MPGALWQRLIQLLLPTRCVLCQQIGPEVVCHTCHAGLEPVGALRCLRCGRRRLTGFASPDCAECYGSQLAVTRARSLYIYNAAGRALLAEYKFHGHIGAGNLLANELATWAGSGWSGLYDQSELAFDMLVPIPLHVSRMRERRFNQSELLARALARTSGVPVETGLLLRTRRTETQVGLSASQRWINVRGAFAVEAGNQSRLSGRRVLLVDDLMTTGATASACSRALKRAGAAAIYALTVFSTLQGIEPAAGGSDGLTRPRPV